MSVNEDISTTLSPKCRDSTDTLGSAFIHLRSQENPKMCFKYIKQSKRVTFSDEIKVVFVSSYKKYNKLEPIYKRHEPKREENTCNCNCSLF